MPSENGKCENDHSFIHLYILLPCCKGIFVVCSVGITGVVIGDKEKDEPPINNKNECTSSKLYFFKMVQQCTFNFSCMHSSLLVHLHF